MSYHCNLYSAAVASVVASVASSSTSSSSSDALREVLTWTTTVFSGCINVYKSLNNEINDFVTKYRDDFKLCLSGSGSSMFVVYESHHELDKILKIIPSNWRFFLTKPLQYAPLTMKF